MIKLSRLDSQEIAINCDLIAWMEARPDTIVRMLAGESIPVRESLDEVIRRIEEYRTKLLRDAGLPGMLTSGAGRSVPPALRIVERAEDDDGEWEETS
jgi:flagellar protein FlbD